MKEPKVKWAHNGVPYQKKQWCLNFFFPAWIRSEQRWQPPFVRYTRYYVWNPVTQQWRTVWTIKGWKWSES